MQSSAPIRGAQLELGGVQVEQRPGTRPAVDGVLEETLWRCCEGTHASGQPGFGSPAILCSGPSDASVITRPQVGEMIQDPSLVSRTFMWVLRPLHRNLEKACRAVTMKAEGSYPQWRPDVEEWQDENLAYFLSTSFVLVRCQRAPFPSRCSSRRLSVSPATRFLPQMQTQPLRR